uniref:Uncharacterized protein MANES_16G114500 n=2 Tax=Rhizophora mucronata TaxID=61149 RepID=A0A2P2LKF0_RHIMU
MGDEKSTMVMATRDRERDRELLIPVADSAAHDDAESKPSSSSSSFHHSGRETFYKVFRSWASKKFMTGWSGILSSIALNLQALVLHLWIIIFVIELSIAEIKKSRTLHLLGSYSEIFVL